MQLYKIFNYQRDVLIQQNMGNGTKYNPVKDINGHYFITPEEFNSCGLGNKELFVPPIPPIA